jgi:hypothetical protein
VERFEKHASRIDFGMPSDNDFAPTFRLGHISPVDLTPRF